jgi:hypothetical protein
LGGRPPLWTPALISDPIREFRGRVRYRVGERLSWDPPNGGVVRK